MHSFAYDLDKLIAKHLGKPIYGDEFVEIIDALHARANSLAEQADRLPFSDESEAEFPKQVRTCASTRPG